MEPPLIAPAFRRAARAGALLGAAVFLSLAVLTFHAKRTAFDSWAFRFLPAHISPSHAEFLLGFTEPAVSVLLLTLTVVCAVSVRRPDLAVLAVLGPALGTAFASDVAKPFIHRTMFTGTVGTYPSGHETGVACTALVLIVALGQLPLRRAAKYTLAAVLVVWIIVAAVGLTRFYYHYATDTIGALGFSVAVMFGLAALLDRYWPARLRRPRRRQPRARENRPGRQHQSRPLPSRRPLPVRAEPPEPQLTPRA